MADYVVRVEASTDKAERDLSRVEQYIKRVDRKVMVDVQLPNIQQSISAIAQFGQVTAKVAKQALDLSRALNVGPGAVLNDLEELFNKVAVSGEKAGRSLLALKDATPTRILGTSFDIASTKALSLSRNVASIGFELFGLTQSVKIVQQAFGGFFNETIGREIRLQEALLQTKTTLISTADVIQNGQRLTDPYQALLALEQPIETTLESIRRRSLDIAGTTSDAIVSVFGVVAAQIGGIGGSLKDAEDLAISFAGALGTIGMADPVLANQEIRSILSGTIDRNSRLAVMLGLTNEEVQKAKSSADGLIGFLKKRLEGFTAGQKTAAQQFAGITSNIQEVREEMSRAFGKPILEPLLVGLTEVYTRLSDIFDRLKAISGNAGKAVANVATVLQQSVAQAPALRGLGGKTDGFVRVAEEATGNFAQTVRASMDDIRPLLARLISEVLEGIARIGQGLGALLAGFASFKFEEFKILATTFANMATILNNTVVPAIQAVLNLYGQLLAMPLVQYLNQVAATHGVLERLGVNSVVRLIGTWKFYQESINTAIGWVQKFEAVVRGVLQGALNAIAGAIQGIGRAVSGGLIAAMEGLAALMGRVFGTAIVLVQRLGQVFITVSQNIAQVFPALAPLAPILEKIGKSMFYVEEAIRKAGLSFKKFAVNAAQGLEVVKVKADQTANSVRNLGTIIGTQLVAGLQKLGGAIQGLLVGFIKLQLLLFAMQAITAAATEAWGRYQRGQEQAAASGATLRSLKLLQTQYADLGDEMDEATRRARAFHLSMVENRYAANQQEIERLGASIKKMQDEMNTPGIQSWGELMRNIFVDPRIALEVLGERFSWVRTLIDTMAEAFNTLRERLSSLAGAGQLIGSAFAPLGHAQAAVFVLIQQITKLIQKLTELGGLDIVAKLTAALPGAGLLSQLATLAGGPIAGRQGIVDDVNKKRIEEDAKYKAKLEKEQREIEAQFDRKRQAEGIQLAKKAREANLKELKEYEWQLERQLFSKKQEMERQALQLERQEGEFRIDQVARANALQLEGVEGAAAAGLQALNEYLTNKAKGELELQTMEKELTIELANLERQVVDYRYEMEKKIAELRKRAAQYEAQAAAARAAGGASGGGTGGLTGDSGRSTGPHLDVRGTNREAVINEAMHHIQSWQAAGVEYIQLSNIRQDVKNITDPAKLRPLVEREMAKHGERVRKGMFAVDIAVPVNTPVNARLGTPSFDGGGGGWVQTNLDTGNQLLHMSASSSASPRTPAAGASGGTGRSTVDGYLRRLSYLETDHNPRPNESGSGANGWFQAKGPFRQEAMAASGGKDPWSSDYNTSAASVWAWIKKHRPQAAAAIEAGRVDEADAILSKGTWSALPGGAEARDAGAQQRARAFLTGGGAPPSASSGGSTPGLDNLPVDAGMDFSKVEQMRKDWESTVSRIGDLLKKSNELRKKIQEAKTLEELQDLGKKAFPRIPLEGYANQLIGLEEELKLLRDASIDTFDPARIASAAEAQTKLKIAAREYLEIQEKLKELTDPKTGKKLTEAEATAALASTKKAYEQQRKDIIAEQELKNKVSDASLVTQSVDSLKQEVRAIQNSTKAQLLQRQNEMEKAYADPDDYLKQRMLDAELQVSMKRLELEEKHNGNLEKITPELDLFTRATYTAAQQLAEMDEVLQEFAEGMALAKEATDNIVGGVKGGLSSLLSGGGFQEAAKGMTKSIADGFVDMMLDYAFKPMEELLMKQFQGLFNVKDPEEEKRKATIENTAAIKENTAAMTGQGTATPETALPSAPTSASNNIVGFDSAKLKATEGLAAKAFSMDTLVPKAEELSKSFEKLDFNLQALPKDVTKTALSMEQLVNTTSQVPPAQEKTIGAMQKYVTGLASIATAAMGIVGGIQQIKEGGTSNVLGGIGSIFMGIAGGISGFSSLFPGRANGGGINMGVPKTVGERGPELFMPPENGRIISNEELRSAMRGGSSKESSAARLSMSFQTTKFMDREWVDREQLEEAVQRAERNGARRGARDGADRAIDRLMQSPQTRKRVGIR